VFDPDGANQLPGESIRRLVNEVRREFFSRGEGRSSDSIQVVAIEVYDGLSVDAQATVATDLLQDCDVVLDRNAEEIFAASDTPQAIIVDLICEVVCHELSGDPLVVMENENREAMAD
jgi:hypothetical protein